MNIHDYERKVHSQFGNDGVLLELVRRLNPPAYFVEIGAGDGSENNTRILAEDLRWTGIWVDADPGNAIRALPIGDPLGIRTICDKVTVEGSSYLKSQVPSNFGVLSIDVDGNDWHLWRAFCGTQYPWRPYIVVIEAQIQRPHDVPWVMPYEPSYVWDNVSQDCGASVFSMKTLGAELGYTCLGLTSNMHDPNMYFVRDDLVHLLGNE